MIYCQRCGGTNEDGDQFCRLCGQPLQSVSGSGTPGAPRSVDAVIPSWLSDPPVDELPADSTDSSERRRQPLPPIPTGGLADAMPSWLAPEPPETAVPTSPAAPAVDNQIDVKGIIVDDDLPAWIRALADADDARNAQPSPNPLTGSDPIMQRRQLPNDLPPPLMAIGPTVRAERQTTELGDVGERLTHRSRAGLSVSRHPSATAGGSLSEPTALGRWILVAIAVAIVIAVGAYLLI